MAAKAPTTEVRSIATGVTISEDSGENYISGYASLIGVEDSYGDVIQPGAYRNLDALMKAGWLSDGHRWDSYGQGVVGYFTELREDAKGLYFKAKFHSTDDAQDLRTKIAERAAAGKEVGISIGFFTDSSEEGDMGGRKVRKVTGLSVKEISIVPLPAMPGAQVSEVRDGTGTRLDDQEAEVLDACRALSTRWVEIKGKAETLSETRKARIQEFVAEMKSLVESTELLLAEPLPDIPEVKFDPAVIAEFEATFAGIRKT